MQVGVGLNPKFYDIKKVGEATVCHVKPEHFYSMMKYLKNDLKFIQLLDITAIDYSLSKDDTETDMGLVYIFRSEDFLSTMTVKCYIDFHKPEIDSITSLFDVADWLERETYDQYGVKFINHPNLKRVLNHHEFKGHPLLKSYNIREGQSCLEVEDLLPDLQKRLLEKGVLTQDSEGSICNNHNRDIMYLNLGPSHPASHGTIRSFIALEGETIVGAVSEIGYLHRGFEKSCENHTYNQIIPYTDRLNYCSALTNNVAFAKTIEEMLGVTLPERGIYIRVLLIELSRIIDHMVCLAASLVDMGALTNYFYLFSAREEAYNFLSKLTGARLTNSFMRVGGMVADLYDGYEKDLAVVLAKVESATSDTLKLIEHNRIFLDRTQNVGIVTADEAIAGGFSGPNLRASGVKQDMRKSSPYYFYDTFEFDIPVGSVGDIYDRLMVRFAEIPESISIIRQAIARMPEGDICIKDPSIILPQKKDVYASIEGAMNQFKLTFEGVRVPAQEYYSSLEATNGELGFFVKSDGSGTPYKVKVKAPSFTAMSMLPKIIEDEFLADAIISLGSLNIIAGEMDR
jgi:NADH-quinone oxidoreductase subunit C/D